MSQPLFQRQKDLSAIFGRRAFILKKQFWSLCPRTYGLIKSPALVRTDYITSLPTVCSQKLVRGSSQRHQKPGGDQIPPRNWRCDPASRCGSTWPPHGWPDHSHCGGHCPGSQRWALQRPIPRNRCVCVCTACGCVASNKHLCVVMLAIKLLNKMSQQKQMHNG